MAEPQVSRMGEPARRDMGTTLTGREIGVQRWGHGKSPTETTEFQSETERFADLKITEPMWSSPGRLELSVGTNSHNSN